MKKFILLFLVLYFPFLLPASFVAGQVSSEGKTFWVSFIETYSGIKTFQLFITSKNNTSGTVSVPLGNWSVPFTVAANQTTVVNVPNTLAETIGSETIQNKGIYVAASADISLYAVMKSNAATEASLVLPIAAFGGNTEYFVMSYPASHISFGFSEFVIVAMKDDTDISITPSVVTKGDKPAGVPFTIQLDSGQVYQVQSKTLIGNLPTDLSGTYIKSINSCKPFSVFSGVPLANVPIGCPAGQYLFEQNYPIKTWGKEYFVLPFANQPNGYLYKVVASEDNTTVTIKLNNAPDAIINLNKGQVHQAVISNDVDYPAGINIIGNKPICVAQFMKGFTCNGSLPAKGDPSMLILNPINQTIKKTTFNTVSTPGDAMNLHYVNIVVKNENTDKIKLQGGLLPAASFIPMPTSSGYSYAMIDLVPYGIDPTVGTSFTLESDSSFIAYAYGYGNASSYAYSVGASFENQLHNFNAQPVCIGSTSSFAGFGVNATSFTWDFGDNSPIATGANVTHTYSSIGTYQVKMTITTAGGCGTDYVIKPYRVLPFPTPNLGANRAICPSLTATLQPSFPAAQAGSYTYQWWKGNQLLPQTTATLAVNQIGTYKVRTTNAGGCWGEDEIDITHSTVPTVYITQLAAHYCIDSPIKMLEGTPAGGTFTINGVNATQFHPAALGVGAHKVKYRYAENNAACTGIDSLLVTVHALPAVNIVGLQSTYCATNTRIPLVGTPAGGTWKLNNQPYLYDNIKLDSIGAGIYTLAYTYTNAQNCAKTTDRTIVINPLPTLFFLNLPLGHCIDSAPFALTALPAGGSFMINGTSATTFNPQLLGVGNHTVSYTFTDAKNCTNTLTQPVQIIPLPTLTLDLQARYCIKQGLVTLKATPEGGIFKVNGVIATDFHTVALGAGNHTVEYIYTSNVCSNQTSQNFEIYGIQPKIQGVKNHYCSQNTAFNLTGTPAGGVWRIDGVVSADANPLFSPSTWALGEHTLEYTYQDAENCQGMATQKVYIHPPLPPVNYAGLKICSQSSTRLLDAGEGATYLWSNQAETRSITINQAGKYTVTVRDTLNCITVSEIEVAEHCEPKFFIPNTFTPNGDGLNDVLKIFGQDFYQMKVHIYNRWGELIFISNRKEDTWDGMVNGKPAPAGVYVCTVRYLERPDAKEQKYTAFVQLIR